MGAAEIRVLTEVAGLFRPDEPDSDNEVSASTLPDLNITGVFRAYYLASGESLPLSDFINSEYSAADVAHGDQARKVTSSPRVKKTIAFASMLAAEQPLLAIGLLACWSGRLLSQLYFSLLGRIQDVPPHAPIKITCVLGRRRCGGMHSVSVQQACGPASFRSPTFLPLSNEVAKDSSFIGTTIFVMSFMTQLQPRYAVTPPTIFWRR